MEDRVYVGRLLSEVERELREKAIPFVTINTRSTNKRFVTDDTCLYVIRQQVQGKMLTLTVAAKMGKEVS